MLCIDPGLCIQLDHPHVVKEHIEEEVEHDPEFHVALQGQRRLRLGLEDPQVKSLMASRFVSLGTSCSVATALQALGVRGEAGPFDWLRISAQGVGYLLRTEFQDFFDTQYTSSKTYNVAAARHWEGSFWHHDVGDPEVQLTFRRRIERFLRLDRAGRSLIFVRAVNSSEELLDMCELYLMLKLHFPASQVRLAVLIDLQEAAGAFCTEDLGKDVVFLPIHQAAWLQKSPAQGHAHVREMLVQTSWAYCQGIARAVHIWTGQPVAWLATVKQLQSRLLQFQGGNCRMESYDPRFVETSVTSLLWKVLSCA